MPLGAAALSAWTGGGCSGAGGCSVFVAGATTVTATFDAVLPTVPNYGWTPERLGEMNRQKWEVAG